jgi:hypothetical protein
MRWYQKLFSRAESQGPADAAPPREQPSLLSEVSPVSPSARDQADQYLARVQEKTNRLAEEFAQGAVNRAQFISLFEHYQKERQTIERMLAVSPEDWRQAATEGKSLVIRREHSARALGFAIYENETGLPIATLGSFDLDPALMVPMLSSYREATREMFGSRLRSTQIENGRWVCFVSGEITTMIALFNTEPAAGQLRNLQDSHSFFEKANHPALTAPPIRTAELVFPQEYFLK